MSLSNKMSIGFSFKGGFVRKSAFIIVFIWLAGLPAFAGNLAFNFSSDMRTRVGLSPLEYLPVGATNFTYVYDVSDQAIGNVEFVEIDVTSLNGQALKPAAGNGLSVDGGVDGNWLDYGEDLDFSVTLKDAGSNDVSAAYAINLINAEIRSGLGGALVFNNGSATSTVYSTTLTGGTVSEVLDVAMEGSDSMFSVSRNDVAIAFQLNDIELEILPQDVQVVSLSGGSMIEDTYLRGPNNESAATYNYGNSTALLVGGGVTASAEANGLIRVPDLSSVTNWSVTRAVLRLYDYDHNNQTTNVTINAYEVTATNHGWVVGSSQGERETGACSWRFPVHNSVEWAGGRLGCGVAGTDYTTNVVAAATSVDGIEGWVDFILDASVVQRWVDDPTENHGLVLISQGSGDQGEVVFFRSCQFDDAAFQPQLILEGVAAGTKVVSQIDVLDSNQVEISWESVLDLPCTLQCCTDLIEGSWSNVVEGITGTGVLNATNDTTAPQAFYQVIYE